MTAAKSRPKPAPTAVIAMNDGADTVAGGRREEVTRQSRNADRDIRRTKTRTTRPALDVLQRDQQRLLTEGDRRRDPQIVPLSDGFRTLWEMVSWYQAAAVRTLGRVDNVIEPTQIMPDSGLADYLLDREPESEYVRMRVVESMQEACNLAYRDYRLDADERVAGDGNSDNGTKNFETIDPTNEKAPAMRPAFRLLDEQQAARLSELWVGFDGRSSVEQWVSKLSPSTNGCHEASISNQIVSDPVLSDALVDQESRQAQLSRARFAISQLLPAFVEGAETTQGAEQSESETSKGGWQKA